MEDLSSESKIKKLKMKQKNFSDTIGSILLSKDNQGIASMIIATSSGGPWLKLPGRMGSVNNLFALMVLFCYRLLSEEQVSIFSMLNLIMRW